MLDFFVAAPGLGLDGREPAELVPVDVHFSEDAVQRFNVGPASCGAYGTTLGLAETLERFGSARLGRPHRRARSRRARGDRGRPDAGVPVRGAAPDPHARRRSAPPSTRRRDGSSARATPIRLPELGDLLDRLGAEGPGVPLQRRRGRLGERLGARARWHAEPRGPELVRGDRARAGARDLPGPRGDHEPAAVVRRDPDRGRARDPRATRAAARPVRDRRGDRVHQPRPGRGVPRGPGHRGLPGALPRQEGARLRGHRRALAPW